MFLSVYEYFSGPSTESTPLGSAIPLTDFFKSSGSPSPSGGNAGSPRLPITGNKYVCESEPGAGPYCKTRYFPSMLHHAKYDAPTTTGLPRHSDTPAFDRDDPYPGCPSGRPLSISHLATPPPDPESPPPVAFSSPIRPAAVCKCSS